MAVDRLVYRDSGQRLAAVPPPGVSLQRYAPSSDPRVIADLVDACRSAAGPALSAGGVRAELTSRPGRLVTTWLAREGEDAVGLVAVVAAGHGPALRHSIAWLLVAERARRRGVGRTLAAVAVGAALAEGARDVWVETRTDWTPAVAFWNAVGFRPAR